jgi:hypothetical protein
VGRHVKCCMELDQEHYESCFYMKHETVKDI